VVEALEGMIVGDLKVVLESVVGREFESFFFVLKFKFKNNLNRVNKNLNSKLTRINTIKIVSIFTTYSVATTYLIYVTTTTICAYARRICIWIGKGITAYTKVTYFKLFLKINYIFNEKSMF